MRSFLGVANDFVKYRSAVTGSSWSTREKTKRVPSSDHAKLVIPPLAKLQVWPSVVTPARNS